MNYVEHFREELVRQEKSTNTISNYLRAISDYSSFIEGRTGEKFIPKDMIELDIKEYKSYLLTVAKQNPTTINNKLSGLAKFCEFLVAVGALSSNPAMAIKKVKIQNTNTSPKTLDKNNLYKLRREFHKGGNKRDIAIFELLYNTGVRVSELCNIELDDIELGERKGTLTIRAGKGDKFRSIPLNSAVRQAVNNYLDVRPLSNNNKLLLGQRGNIKREAVFRVLKQYADRAGIPEVSPHVLRHQFCKELLNNGANIVTVASLAGHSNINTTAIYTQPTEEEKALALEMLR